MTQFSGGHSTTFSGKRITNLSSHLPLFYRLPLMISPEDLSLILSFLVTIIMMGCLDAEYISHNTTTTFHHHTAPPPQQQHIGRSHQNTAAWGILLFVFSLRLSVREDQSGLRGTRESAFGFCANSLNMPFSTEPLSPTHGLLSSSLSICFFLFHTVCFLSSWEWVK